MRHVLCGAKERERNALAVGGFALTNEKEKRAGSVDVPLARGAVDAGGTLGLPVEQALANGVVLVHRRGGVLPLAFVQRDEEQIRI